MTLTATSWHLQTAINLRYHSFFLMKLRVMVSNNNINPVAEATPSGESSLTSSTQSQSAPETTALTVAKGDYVTVTSDTVLKRLKAEVIKQHGLVLQSQATMLIHAMNAGELLLRAKKDLSPAAFREWLAAGDEHGHSLSLRTSQRYMQVAAGAELIQRLKADITGRRVDGVTREELLQDVSIREAIRMVSQHDAKNPGKIARKKRSADRNLTPQPILEAVVRCVGALSLDPAADPDAPNHTGAATVWGPEDDGLDTERQWSGTIFVHPPHDAQREWIQRALDEVAGGNAQTIVLLIASYTDSIEFRMLNNCPRVFLHERPDGFAQPATLFVLGNAVKPRQLAAAFRDLGDTYVPVV